MADRISQKRKKRKLIKKVRPKFRVGQEVRVSDKAESMQSVIKHERLQKTGTIIDINFANEEPDYYYYTIEFLSYDGHRWEYFLDDNEIQLVNGIERATKRAKKSKS